MHASEKRTLRHGFTLIELLIVVAIIAILAAIAVPNFLEAQTRSKISRVKADMRTQATAIESYYVDNNRYPPDYTDVLAGKTKYNMLIERMKHLTTPIAYITTLPTDIFADIVVNNGAKRVNGNVQSSAPYRFPGTNSTGTILYPIVYDYAKNDRTGYTTLDTPTVWNRISMDGTTVRWAFNSAGPQGRIFEYLGFDDLVIYDPTNGTVSNGQVIRTNLGADDKPKS